MKVERIPIFPNRTRALAAFIKCRYCGGEMVQVSAKDGGCYGCCKAKRDGCDNKLRISGQGVEAVILDDLKEKFLTAKGLKHADELVLEGLAGAIDCSLANAHPIRTCTYFVAHTSIQAISLL